MIDFIIFITFITILFIIYVEYNVGNILYRTNSEGTKSVNCESMINFLIHPLHNSFLWNCRALDINFPFIIFISSLVYINLKP